MSSAPENENCHLAINLIQQLPKFSGGIETYAHELIPRIADRLPGWRISVFINREGVGTYSDWDDRCEWIDAGLSWHDKVKRLLWESTVLPRKVRRLQPTLLHNMTNTACLRPGCPQITSIFDATQILQPAPSLPSAAFRLLLKSAARRSDIVLTISESAAGDIADVFGTPRDQIAVALLAARAPNPSLNDEQLFEKFGVDRSVPYFLTPAARRPNKNISALLRAYALLDVVDRPQLLLVGADGGKDDEINVQIEQLGIGDGARLIGWVTDDELDSLYASATALVFPSLMEGFGLPILEAMQCGCPVATSNVSSMPEVGGDAAVYFDPTDDSEIAAAMRRLAGDPQLRAELSVAGTERAKSFSWDRAADETVDVYRRLLKR